MKLTKTERWMLSNQYRILEALYPNERKSLSEHREAIENGYELHYENISQHICRDEDCLTKGQCEEAIDILDMFTSLAKASVKDDDIIFEGFDKNSSEESKYSAYADYYCKHDGGRFEELRGIVHSNSHLGMIDLYRRMLKEWKNSANKYQLTKDDVQRIIKARAYPNRES